MRLQCLTTGRMWELNDGDYIGADPGAQVVLHSLLPYHARIVAAQTRPAVWYLITAGDRDEVNGHPVLGGVARLGSNSFTARLRLNDTLLECNHTPLAQRSTASVPPEQRCPRCARLLVSGEQTVVCECGARAVHLQCFGSQCYQCGAQLKSESDE